MPTARRTALAACVLAALALAGCARGVTIDDAYGRPDATRWTYFDGPADDVLRAITEYYSIRNVATESARDEAGGVVLTLAFQNGGADVSQILVQATDVEGFQTRAQVYPTRRPLPQSLEQGVSARL